MTINSVVVSRAVKAAMPHLDVVVWDLEPFMNAFHNWRKNIVFVECEKIAVSELAGKLAVGIGPSVMMYTGVRKPHAKDFAVEAPEASVVVLAREDFSETVVDDVLGVRVPSLEERLAVLLMFSLRETLPIEVKEAVNVLSYFLRRNEVEVPKLHRFATRRYIGWFLNIALYVLYSKGLGGVGVKHAKSGKRCLEAVKEVEAIE